MAEINVESPASTTQPQQRYSMQRPAAFRVRFTGLIPIAFRIEGSASVLCLLLRLLNGTSRRPTWSITQLFLSLETRNSALTRGLRRPSKLLKYEKKNGGGGGN